MGWLETLLLSVAALAGLSLVTLALRMNTARIHDAGRGLRIAPRGLQLLPVLFQLVICCCT
jgi:hypothetical protein